MKRPLVLSLLLAAFVVGYVANGVAWYERFPVPTQSLHHNDLVALSYGLVLTGEADGSRIEWPDFTYGEAPHPLGSPRLAILQGMFTNGSLDRYFTRVPISYIVSISPMLVFPTSPVTARAGMLVLVGLLALGVGLATRALSTPSAGVAAGVLVALVPGVVGSTWYAFPSLGNMVAVALPVGFLLMSDGFRRIGFTVLAALATAVAPRWGESSGDAYRVLAILIVPIVFSAGAAILVREGRKRALAGLVLYAALVVLVMDISWVLASAASYMVPQSAEGSGFPIWDASPQPPPDAPLARIVENNLYYAIALRFLTAGLPATVLLGLGLVGLAIGGRPGWKTLSVILAPLPLFLLLGLSAKRENYYLAQALPVLAVLAAAGIHRLPRVGRHLFPVAAALLVPGWLWLTLGDLVPVLRRPTGPLEQILLAGETRTPRSMFGGRVWAFPMVRPPLATTLEAAQTVTSGPFRAVLESATSDEDLLVLIGKEEGAAPEQLAFTLQALRPRSRVRTVPVTSPSVPPQLLGTEKRFRLVIGAMPRDRSRPASLPAWLPTPEPIAWGRQVVLYRITWNQGR